MVPYLVNAKSLTLFIKGKPVLLASDDKKYKACLQMIQNGASEQEFENLFAEKPVDTLNPKFLAYSDALAERWGFLVENNLPTTGLKKFVDNCEQNPDPGAVKELFMFLDACDLPITDDGCFLTYKKVRDDYMDIYSKSFDNHVGKRPSMKREDCCSDRKKTCETGLHVCSVEYLEHYGGGESKTRIVVCKVNPKDVVSVPEDYNNQKMRVCEYEVVYELTDFNHGEVIKPMAVVEEAEETPKKSLRRKASEVLKANDTGRKFDEYCVSHNLPEELADMTAKERKNVKAVAGRLYWGKPCAAGKDINGCKTLTEMRNFICSAK